jgi:hypothetical protein
MRPQSFLEIRDGVPEAAEDQEPWIVSTAEQNQASVAV